MKQPQYKYNGDEKITITAKDLMILKLAIDYGIQATSRFDYPEVMIYVDTTTGAKVNKPKKEDLLSGKYVYTVDPEATFSANNMKISYDGDKLKSEMLIGQKILNEIHQLNIETGVAKQVTEETADAQ